MRASVLRSVLPVVLLVAVAAGGCSSSTENEAVSASKLADRVATEQQKQNPDTKISDVSCDGEIKAEKGAEQRCHASDVRGDRYGLTVTVTSVDDGKLSFSTDPDPGQTVEPDELEPEVTAKLTELSGGTAPDAVDCPDDLPGRVGATTTCILTAGEDRLETTVTVTSAEGPKVGFDIKVADEPLP
ncbi:DUF4333 domain-containing protein [Nocardioides plantarum]|uniref:DUF4333 domain-containing protein n=1 Tax=Nocardioides plantarum TaxID=29299 RepID=A0ABV5KB05_9ACTN|nr:DUF4333 domain-containing protein [Nocardioides plantarum]